MKTEQSVPLVHKEGGFTKEGKEYTAFWGCQNFKNPDIACRFTWRPARQTERQPQIVNKVDTETAKKIFATEVFRRLDEIQDDLKYIKEFLNK